MIIITINYFRCTPKPNWRLIQPFCFIFGGGGLNFAEEVNFVYMPFSFYLFKREGKT